MDHVVPLADWEPTKELPVRTMRTQLGNVVVNWIPLLPVVPGEVTRYSTETGLAAAAESVTGTVIAPADSETTLPTVAKPTVAAGTSSSVR